MDEQQISDEPGEGDAHASPALKPMGNVSNRSSHWQRLASPFSRPAVEQRGGQLALKHGADRVLAAVALLCLAPLLLVLALMVRVSSAGPVIFRQRRVGRDGRVFELLKFRTVIPADAHRRLSSPSGSGPGAGQSTDRGPGQSTDRGLQVGQWLRANSLDELPQLWNVLRGQMSLIGPRPERPEFAQQFAGEVAGYDLRHRVKPGITGWAQVNGMRGQSIGERVQWDNHYIENWSPALDLRILGLSFAALLRLRKGRRNTAPGHAIDLSGAASRLTTSSAAASPPERSGSSARERTPALVAVPTGAAAPTIAPTPALAPAPAAETAEGAEGGVPVLSGVVPSLRLVSGNPEAGSSVWFCGYCGEAPSTKGVPAPMARVCRACGQGLLLEAQSAIAPGRDEAFLVVDSRLTVQALSRCAERTLGVSEEEATNLPIAELLVGADAERDAEVSLASMLVQAADGGEYIERTFVRPRDTFGVRVPVRISSCGPPRAALIVFESGAPQPPRLRLAPETGQTAAASTSAG